MRRSSTRTSTGWRPSASSRRDELVEGLEDWAGEPFLLVMGEPYLAQVVWSAAHGMVTLELDGRYPPDSDLDRTWAEAAAAFTAALG